MAWRWAVDSDGDALGICLSVLNQYEKSIPINLTVADVCRKYIKPTTVKRGCSLAKYLSDNNTQLDGKKILKKARYYVIYSSNGRFSNLISALNNAIKEVEGEVYVFIDIVMLNLNNSMNDLDEIDFYQTKVPQLINQIGQSILVLEPWERGIFKLPQPLVRSYCLWEIITSFPLKNLIICQSQTYNSRLEDKIKNGVDQVIVALNAIDIKYSMNTKQVLKHSIINHIKSNHKNINQVLRDYFLNWFLEYSWAKACKLQRELEEGPPEQKRRKVRQKYLFIQSICQAFEACSLFKQSEVLYSRNLKVHQQIPRGDLNNDQIVCINCNDLAELIRCNLPGKLHASIELYRTALEIDRQIGTKSDILDDLHMLGRALVEEGDSAEEAFRINLELLDLLNSRKSNLQGGSTRGLKHMQSSNDETGRQLVQLIQLRSSTHVSLQHLNTIVGDASAEVEDSNEGAMFFYEECPGILVSTLEALGILYLQKKQYAKAIEEFTKAVSFCESFLTSDDDETNVDGLMQLSNVLLQLALAYQARGRGANHVSNSKSKQKFKKQQSNGSMDDLHLAEKHLLYSIQIRKNLDRSMAIDQELLYPLFELYVDLLALYEEQGPIFRGTVYLLSAWKIIQPHISIKYYEQITLLAFYADAINHTAVAIEVLECFILSVKQKLDFNLEVSVNLTLSKYLMKLNKYGFAFRYLNKVLLLIGYDLDKINHSWSDYVAPASKTSGFDKNHLILIFQHVVECLINVNDLQAKYNISALINYVVSIMPRGFLELASLDDTALLVEKFFLALIKFMESRGGDEMEVNKKQKTMALCLRCYGHFLENTKYFPNQARINEAIDYHLQACAIEYKVYSISHQGLLIHSLRHIAYLLKRIKNFDQSFDKFQQLLSLQGFQYTTSNDSKKAGMFYDVSDFDYNTSKDLRGMALCLLKLYNQRCPAEGGEEKPRNEPMLVQARYLLNFSLKILNQNELMLNQFDIDLDKCSNYYLIAYIEYLYHRISEYNAFNIKSLTKAKEIHYIRMQQIHNQLRTVIIVNKKILLHELTQSNPNLYPKQVADCLYDLAMLSYMQHDVGTAITYYNQLLNHLQKSPFYRSVHEAYDCAQTLSYILLEQGNIPDSIPYYKIMLQLSADVFDPFDENMVSLPIEFAGVLESLCVNLTDTQQRFVLSKDAFQLYEEALRQATRIYQNEPFKIGLVCNRFATFELNRKRFEAGADLFRREISVYEMCVEDLEDALAVIGDADVDAVEQAKVENELALYSAQANLSYALYKHAESLNKPKSRRKSSVEDELDDAVVECLDEAEDYLRQAIDGLNDVYTATDNKEHLLSSVDYMSNLAKILILKTEYDDAAVELERLIDLEKTFGTKEADELVKRDTEKLQQLYLLIAKRDQQENNAKYDKVLQEEDLVVDDDDSEEIEINPAIIEAASSPLQYRPPSVSVTSSPVDTTAAVNKTKSSPVTKRNVDKKIKEIRKVSKRKDGKRRRCICRIT